MLKMIQVIGISENSYEDAIRNAIDQLTSHSYGVHFFIVKEQRGSFHHGELQFQIVLDIAVDFLKKEGDVQISTHKESKTNKLKSESAELVCEWCGCTMQVPRNTDYEQNPKTLVCNSCGRIICISDKYCKSKFK